ncbi:sensor histidine kinase [Deinococcus multiflagellatus]|uniref:histidine kinase n=1 Tax=Deinococcus multiflagellatus TaxID=1656887 RepID=A0ABW1ZS86_9DEIO|nr:ATP-binding protein [Deinococcus multiflagellatus]MBZ9713632.1 PAS domain-containing protein [Deinococcus multiflagellatus]
MSLPVQALQAALDALSDTIAIVDEGGVIRATNAAWQGFMQANGGDPETCSVGANYLDTCDRAQGPCADEGRPVASGLRAVLDGTSPEFSLEYPCHSPDEQRWYCVHIKPFRSDDQRYATVLHENVTDRKLTEIRASDLDAEVAQGVRTQTADLRQENSELDAFIGAVSHDLRAPVRHLQGFLGLLRRRGQERLNADDRQMLDVLDASATRLGHMIDELLGLSRVSQRALQIRPVNLAQVVLRAWANMAPETQGRDIDWVAGDLPVLQGDADLLQLAFENLLSNAVKYTGGRATARIEVGAREEQGSWVVFVQDDGVGFDPRYTHRLFGAFQRLHPEKEFQGIGLGLVNVKRIIERHGGEIWAQSQPGDGAIFSLRFPKPAAR